MAASKSKGVRACIEAGPRYVLSRGKAWRASPDGQWAPISGKTTCGVHLGVRKINGAFTHVVQTRRGLYAATPRYVGETSKTRRPAVGIAGVRKRRR